MRTVDMYERLSTKWPVIWCSGRLVNFRNNWLVLTEFVSCVFSSPTSFTNENLSLDLKYSDSWLISCIACTSWFVSFIKFFSCIISRPRKRVALDDVGNSEGTKLFSFSDKPFWPLNHSWVKIAFRDAGFAVDLWNGSETSERRSREEIGVHNLLKYFQN